MQAMKTLPGELATGPGLHTMARVELTNGIRLTGRITEMDPLTLNLKITALTHVAVRRPRDPSEEELLPVAMRCVCETVVRGAAVRYIDFLPEPGAGAGRLDEIRGVAQAVRPVVQL